MSESAKGKDLHRIRSRLASLFSDIFLHPPSFEQLESLIALLEFYYQHQLDENGCFARGLNEFDEWRGGLEEMSEQEQQLTVQRNYTTLFCVGQGVVTTASAVLSPQRIHKWEPWTKVRRFYYEYGLRLVEGSPLYEDSIVTELAFYSLLIDQLERLGGSKRKETLKIQQRFLEKHLLIWLPQFCEELHSTAGKESAYSSVASFLTGFMQAEPRLIHQVLQVESV